MLRRTTWLAIVGVALLVIAVGVALWLLPQQVPQNIRGVERVKATNDIRTLIVQGIGGLGLLAGLFFTARTISVTRDGHLTERFGKAVEQVGSENSPTSIGGIYALERIARTSRRDHDVIMEFLSQFVRNKSPLDVERPEQTAAAVQAAIRAIGRRRTTFDRRTRPGHGIELHKTNLGELDLTGARLTNMNLSQSDFTGAFLRGTDFRRSWVADAVFADVDVDEETDLRSTSAFRTTRGWSYKALRRVRSHPEWWPPEHLDQGRTRTASERYRQAKAHWPIRWVLAPLCLVVAVALLSII